MKKRALCLVGLICAVLFFLMYFGNFWYEYGASGKMDKIKWLIFFFLYGVLLILVALALMHAKVHTVKLCWIAAGISLLPTVILWSTGIALHFTQQITEFVVTDLSIGIISSILSVAMFACYLVGALDKTAHLPNLCREPKEICLPK